MAQNSGPAWCARFPTSTALDDLAEPFRSNCRNFVAALRAAGAKVTVSATYRPPERAYLMHWACRIANGEVHPRDVAVLAGVDIDWTHGGDLKAARAAAKAMVAAYGIRYPAALSSRHTQCRAVDMTITWAGALSVVDGKGQRIEIADVPCTGDNRGLHAVGRTYRVFKLVSDPPHWSDDGR